MLDNGLKNINEIYEIMNTLSTTPVQCIKYNSSLDKEAYLDANYNAMIQLSKDKKYLNIILKK